MTIRLPVVPESPLPPLYAGWVGALLGGAAIPPETHATCGDCAMCADPGEAPRRGTAYFDPTVKCCSYLPEIYNFLAGRILAEKSPAYARRASAPTASCSSARARRTSMVASAGAGEAGDSGWDIRPSLRTARWTTARTS